MDQVPLEEVTLEQLNVYCKKYKLRDAAIAFCVSMNALRKHCRKVGMLRWGYKTRQCKEVAAGTYNFSLETKKNCRGNSELDHDVNHNQSEGETLNVIPVASRGRPHVKKFNLLLKEDVGMMAFYGKRHRNNREDCLVADSVVDLAPTSKIIKTQANFSVIQNSISLIKQDSSGNCQGYSVCHASQNAPYGLEEYKAVQLAYVEPARLAPLQNIRAMEPATVGESSKPILPSFREFCKLLRNN